MNKLKLTITIVVASLIFYQGFAQENKLPADNIIGLYWSPQKDAKIQIYKKDNHYYGKSIWVAAPRKDSNNPNKSLNTRDVLGIELFTDFTYSDGVYTEGRIYDPQTGKTYNCKMNLNGNILKVRGYIGISLFGRTELFERLN